MTDREWIDRWRREYQPEDESGPGLPFAFVSSMIELTVVVVLLLLLFSLCCSSAQSQTVANALPQLNQQRAARGLYPLQPAYDLQARAEYESIVRAERGIGGHLPGGPSPGRAEGVGQRSGADHYGRNFIACYTTTRKYRYAGAAVATNRRGRSYYTLILR